MSVRKNDRIWVSVVLTMAAALGVSAVRAQGVVGEWNNVQAPPPPALHPVRIDPASSALLLMDFGQANCSREPRCVADIPNVKKLLDQARAHNMLVIYTGFGGLTVMSDIAPQSGEAMVVGRPNKFDGTHLDDLLKQRSVTTVVACGTSANGAELFTAAGATARGYHVIVPVDCMPGQSAYAEQTVVWGMANDPGLAPPRAIAGARTGRGSGAGGRPAAAGGYATLTSTDMVHFK